MLRLPSTNAIALELLGAARGNPWVLNSGEAALICVDTEATRRRYVELGFPGHVLRTTGDVFDDALRDVNSRRSERYREICESLVWDEEKPLLLCAFPPDQFNSPDVSRFEFQSFPLLIEEWFDVLHEASRHMNVLVRPHPRLDVAELRRLEGGGVRLTGEITTILIPLCSVYMACISATIRVALGLGKPVVNYDAYRYNYGDFDSAPNVRTVFDAASCRLALEEARISAQSSDPTPSNPWLMPDGAFGPRFAEALFLSTARSPRRRR